MGRLVNYFPTITAFIAFILTLLCLFAGTQLTVLPGVDIFTVSLYPGRSLWLRISL